MLHLRSKHFTATAIAAIILLGAAIKPSRAEDGRLYVTFIKSRAATSGSGSLFYRGERYRIGVDGIDAGKFKSSRIDLIGTASNLQNPSDILGSYAAVEGDSAVIRDVRPARLKNAEGALVELHSTNSGKLFVDLSGLTIHGRGWPSK